MIKIPDPALCSLDLSSEHNIFTVYFTQCTAALTLMFMKSDQWISNLRVAKPCIQRKIINIFTSMYLCVGSLKTHFISLTFSLLPTCIVMLLILISISWCSYTVKQSNNGVPILLLLLLTWASCSFLEQGNYKYMELQGTKLETWT